MSDKLRMSFVKDTDNFVKDDNSPVNRVAETFVETDINKMYVNAERAMILRYINNIAWEKLDTKELRKLYILIGNELESHCQKNKLYDCQRYDCPNFRLSFSSSKVYLAVIFASFSAALITFGILTGPCQLL